jgi:hypothetical protein
LVAVACAADNPDEAIDHTATAIRLSPLDPMMFAWKSFIALAHICAGRYDEAVGWSAKSLLGQSEYPHRSALRPRATRSSGAWTTPERRWRVCVSSIRRCAAPISRRCCRHSVEEFLLLAQVASVDHQMVET